MKSAARLICLLATVAAAAATAEPTRTFIDFDQLNGWETDDHAAALSAFRESCGAISQDGWDGVCAMAQTAPDAREFFERLFQPVLIEDGGTPLFTGYFEPEIDGSLNRTSRYRFPIYRIPPEMPRGTVWLSRQEIEETGVLEGRGLEIAWLSDPVDRYFMQVQGSGRIRLPDGQVLRVGFAAKNGHSYASIGRALIESGTFGAHQASAAAIRNWAQRYPEQGRVAMWANPSYVFFQVISDIDHDEGPLGAMLRPLHAERSIAVDDDAVTLGAPVWLEKAGAAPLNRLMVAQDTGSAINGAQRADIFYGSGVEAGRRAAAVRDQGRMIVLLPNALAFTLLAEVQQ